MNDKQDIKRYDLTMNIWKLCMRSQVSRPFEDGTNRFYFLESGSFVTKEDHLKAMEEQRKACAGSITKCYTDKQIEEYKDEISALKQMILSATIEDKK